MRIFVLLSRFPYPLEKGDKLRAYHQIRVLSKSHEIHLCCLSDKAVKKEWLKELQPFCESIHIMKLNKFMIYMNTALQFFTDKPYQVGYFYQSTIQRKITKLIKTLAVDHIYCQLIRTAEYVKNIHDIPKTIDYQDALSKGMFRRAEIASGIRKKMFQAESKRLSEYENRIFDFFNHHTIISKQDKDYINHPLKDQIRIIKNGISDYFFNVEVNDQQKFELVFTGNMNYPPNVECAEYLVKNIMPKLNSDVNLLLAGASPHQRVKQLESHRVEVSGWLDDIRDAYASARIFVAPLFIGTGLQNKLLEAMAIGIPCITTPLVNNALGAQEGKEILIASTEEEFVECIKRLRSDQNFYKQVQQNAKEFVKTNFSWEQSVKDLESLMES